MTPHAAETLLGGALQGRPPCIREMGRPRIGPSWFQRRAVFLPPPSCRSSSSRLSLKTPLQRFRRRQPRFARQSKWAATRALPPPSLRFISRRPTSPEW